jgi:TolB-like protein
VPIGPPVHAKSLAVLPLENLSPEPENAYFTEGMHAEIISTLSRLTDLEVSSRNSTLAFKGTPLFQALLADPKNSEPL